MYKIKSKTSSADRIMKVGAIHNWIEPFQVSHVDPFCNEHVVPAIRVFLNGMINLAFAIGGDVDVRIKVREEK